MFGYPKSECFAGEVQASTKPRRNNIGGPRGTGDIVTATVQRAWIDRLNDIHANYPLRNSGFALHRHNPAPDLQQITFRLCRDGRFTPD